MPGLLVAEVSWGAQVMTVTVSLPPPMTPGTAPQPTATAPQTASAPAESRAVRTERVRRERGVVVDVRRLPVMVPHDSGTSSTGE